MSTWQFLTAPANLPFSIALCLVVCLFLVEVATTLIGASASLDADADIDAGAEAEGGLADWLHLGHLPALMLLNLFCLGFGLAGFGIQLVARALGGMMSPWLASSFALAVALPFVHLIGRLLKPIFARDDSAAISADALIGHSATITLGDARRGSPSQAKTRDRFGTTHYVLVEPMEDDVTLNPGQEVILVKRSGANYFAVDNHPDSLFRSLDLSDRPNASSDPQNHA